MHRNNIINRKLSFECGERRNRKGDFLQTQYRFE